MYNLFSHLICHDTIKRHMKCIFKLIFLSVFFLTASQIDAESVQFTSDLKLNTRSNEVFLLQKALNSDTQTRVSEEGAGSPGQETDFFGEKTKNAVIRFQEKYASQILEPLNLSTGTGVVGARTRSVLNSQFGGSSFNTDTVLNQNTSSDNTVSNWEENNNYPVITAVMPGEVVDPRNIPVTIFGENFNSKNTVYLSVQDLEIFDGYSTDGKTITLFLNTVFLDAVENLVNSTAQSNDPVSRQKTIDALKLEFNSVGKNGVYVPAVIFVKTDKGESNKFLIKINVLKDGQ